MGQPLVVRDWRDDVPERFRDLPDLITIVDIANIFGYRKEYVRKLRSRRLELDACGDTGAVINALPQALPISQRPLYWEAVVIIEWGLQTGRLNPDTGDPQRLYSPGAPPKSARSQI
jgi:hypothetical protein